MIEGVMGDKVEFWKKRSVKRNQSCTKILENNCQIHEFFQSRSEICSGRSEMWDRSWTTWAMKKTCWLVRHRHQRNLGVLNRSSMASFQQPLQSLLQLHIQSWQSSHSHPRSAQNQRKETNRVQPAYGFFCDPCLQQNRWEQRNHYPVWPWRKNRWSSTRILLQTHRPSLLRPVWVERKELEAFHDLPWPQGLSRFFSKCRWLKGLIRLKPPTVKHPSLHLPNQWQGSRKSAENYDQRLEHSFWSDYQRQSWGQEWERKQPRLRK